MKPPVSNDKRVMPAIKWLAIFLALFATFFLAARPSNAGGWAVVTLRHWPRQVNAGVPVQLDFSIRAHGKVLIPGVAPIIRAVHEESGERIEIPAQPGKRDGDYLVRVNFPEEGTWDWHVLFEGAPTWAHPMPSFYVLEKPETVAAVEQNFDSRVLGGITGALIMVFGAVVYRGNRSKWSAAASLTGVALLLLTMFGFKGADNTPINMEALPAGTASAAYGEVLFQTKGCVSCHPHAVGRSGYDGIQTNVGPDLTDTKLPAEYIRTWLADPAALRPKTLMPNLELSNVEIESLAAFLTGGQ